MCCNVSQFGAVNLFAQVRLFMARSLLLLVLALIAVDAHANTDKFPPDPSAVQPSALTPPFGSTAGGHLVFFKINETTALKGSSSVACQFAASPAFDGHYDKKSGHYTCRVPPHPRPESVEVTIVINGQPFRMPEPYVYTTHGKYDAPVTRVHVSRLQDRVKWVKEQLPDRVKLCAVLKNGNPPGWLGKAMNAASQVDYFCVPRVQDGIALRRAGVKVPIIVMYLTDASYVPQMLYYELQPAAYSLAWVKQASHILASSGGHLKVHLWIDTGMSREGVLPDEALPIARAIDNSPSLHLQGISTHFCCIDEDDLVALKSNNLKNETVLQKQRFDKVVEAIRAEGIGLDALLHASASDGLRYDLTPIFYDMVRVGTMLFENPQPNETNFTWKTKILQVKTMPEGWCINYGCVERWDEDIQVGLVGHIPDDEVDYYIRGQMVEKYLDHETVVVLDLSEFADVKAGEEVTMIFKGDNSVLNTSYSAPITLQDGTSDTRRVMITP